MPRGIETESYLPLATDTSQPGKCDYITDMEDFIRPDQPSKCTWVPNGKAESPHIHRNL